MVVRFEHEQTYDDRVQNSPVKGWFNGMRACLYVYPLEDNTMIDFNRFREYSSLENPNIGLFCGFEQVAGYRVFGFETSKVGLENYVFEYQDFKHTREIVRQILEALIFLHGKGFVHTALGQNDSYIFDQQRNFDYTCVKLSVKDCHRIGSPGAGVHTKGSNMVHFAEFLSVFFCGAQTTPSQAQRRPFRYVPHTRAQQHAAYVHEFRHFIDHLCSGPAAGQLRNHLVFWTSERRLDFLQDTYEYCNELVQAARAVNTYQDPALVAAIRAIDIKAEAGEQWEFLDETVRWDLQQDGGRLGGPYGLLLGIRHLKVHRVPILGRSGVVIYGLKSYQRFDVDIIKGIDLYFSCFVPSFFIGVYTAAQRIIDVNARPSFRKYLDLGFDPGNTELS